MSPAGYLILFVPKKDRKLQLCVNYRQLNAITVKNQYLLLLILELQDRIQESQWFTALGIRGAFNLVQMREGEKWKTGLSNKIRALQIYCNAIWTHKCTGNLSSSY